MYVVAMVVMEAMLVVVVVVVRWRLTNETKVYKNREENTPTHLAVLQRSYR